MTSKFLSHQYSAPYFSLLKSSPVGSSSSTGTFDTSSLLNPFHYGISVSKPSSSFSMAPFNHLNVAISNNRQVTQKNGDANKSISTPKTLSTDLTSVATDISTNVSNAVSSVASTVESVESTISADAYTAMSNVASTLLTPTLSSISIVPPTQGGGINLQLTYSDNSTQVLPISDPRIDAVESALDYQTQVLASIYTVLNTQNSAMASIIQAQVGAANTILSQINSVDKRVEQIEKVV